LKIDSDDRNNTLKFRRKMAVIVNASLALVTKKLHKALLSLRNLKNLELLQKIRLQINTITNEKDKFEIEKKNTKIARYEIKVRTA